MSIKNKLFLILFVLCSKFIIAQYQDKISTTFLNNTFQEFKPHHKLSRPFLKPRKTLVAKLNPLTYVSASLLFLYQHIVSEQIQASCVYSMSCSENMKTQINRKGLIGILAGLNQLGNCANSIKNDYPDYKITKDGKINNTVE